MQDILFAVQPPMTPGLMPVLWPVAGIAALLALPGFLLYLKILDMNNEQAESQTISIIPEK